MFIAVAMLALKGETRTLWFSGDDSGKKVPNSVNT